MGQRANLIVVESHQYMLYYSHWCANTLPTDIFWGHEHATRFAKAQRAVTDDGWLDTTWAEGGCVIDHNAKRLIVFGGEELLFDIPLRRLYMRLLGQVWSNWQVSWAYKGIIELADYVGYDREKVIASCDPITTDMPQLADSPADASMLLSVRHPDRTLSILALNDLLEENLNAGPKIVDWAREQDGGASFSFGDHADAFPIQSGIHIDEITRTVKYWSGPDDFITESCPWVTACWPGYELVWGKDDFESHLDQLDKRVVFVSRTDQQLLEALTKVLLKDSSGGQGVIAIHDIFNNESIEGRGVEINPWATQDARVELPIDERNNILKVAVRKEGLG